MLEAARIAKIIPTDLEYDTSWEMATSLFNDFKGSQWDGPEIDEWSAMTQFLSRPVRKYAYELPSGVSWNSFDSGEVTARSSEEAFEKAKGVLVQKFEAANRVLAASSDTAGLEFFFEPMCITLREIPTF